MTQPTVFIAFTKNGKINSAVAFGEPYGEHPGEVFETVDFYGDGMPDWAGAGICDSRGIGVEAFDALVTALKAAEFNAKEIGFDMQRVPSDVPVPPLDELVRRIAGALNPDDMKARGALADLARKAEENVS